MRRICLILPLCLTLAGCGPTRQVRDPSSQPQTIRVLAAASLSEVFTSLARSFESQHPGVTVETSFAGSASLDAQIEQGAPADVFASADTKSMKRVASFTLDPIPFARNTMTIAVEPGNPKHVSGLGSLARGDLSVVLCALAVPCGKLAAKVLKKAKVNAHVVSLEDNVKGVVTKVRLGEADAGIVYVTDVIASKNALGQVAIPDSLNAITTYEIARLRTSTNTNLAGSFITFVESSAPEFQSRGFLPA